MARGEQEVGGERTGSGIPKVPGIMFCNENSVKANKEGN